MQFKDIIGQEQVKHQLCSSVQEGRIAHAQLFYGNRGVGKLQLAIAYAQYLACPNRTATDSCGVCPSCLQYRNLQNPDLHFAFPIFKEKSTKEVVCNDFLSQFRDIVLTNGYFSPQEWYAKIGADNKQCIIYEAESSEILRKLSLKSFGNGYKTMIIWLPEKMHPACSNKLLKIIEEPPEKTLFLLVSEEKDLLLPTILSRSQQLHVPNLSEQEIARSLRERSEDLSMEDALNYAHMANGSWLRALSLLDNQEETNTNLKMFQSLFRNAWSVGVRKDYKALLDLRDWTSQMASLGRERQKNFLQYAQNQIRENYIRNLSHPELNYQTTEEGHFSEKFSPFVNERNVEELQQEFETAQRQIEQNGNAKIVFFDLCLNTIVLVKR